MEDDDHEDPTLDPRVLEALRSALADDDVLSDIVQAFLDETPDDIGVLTEAARTGDSAAAAAAAHRIKGSALTFGAVRLVRTCVVIESSPSRAQALAPSVTARFRDASEALRARLAELTGGA